ncbi:hypothetical protein DFP72DRAFT_602716 [Ephemerocybe angulata]|uniref:Uncharacterized protein n=1 Tax=Ephemerocybe angulata TaxID=980116 RepID=A0A8H6MDZ4_9AGAR|nr:hypothetical protein DFP72DRAFT_602716 [Tulosesus angulatus]
MTRQKKWKKEQQAPTAPKPKAKVRRSNKRSPAGEAKRRERSRVYLIEKAAKNDEQSVVRLASVPSQFLRIKTSDKNAQKIARKTLGKFTPSSFQLAIREGLFVAPFPKDVFDYLPYDHPRQMVVREDIRQYMDFDSLCIRVLGIYHRMKGAGLKIPTVKETHRSATAALHFGTWQIARKNPAPTADTRKILANPALGDLARELFDILRMELAPVIAFLTKRWCPNSWAKQERTREYIVANSLDAHRPLLPLLDFLGAFFAFAMKEGSSERAHLDWNDHPDSLTWIIGFGQWEGANFCCPQLGVNIPVPYGHVVGCQTRRFLHCGTEVEFGERLTFTLFCDHILLLNGSNFEGPFRRDSCYYTDS